MNDLHVDILPVLNDNYIFVLRDKTTGETAAVDPALAPPVLQYLEQNRLAHHERHYSPHSEPHRLKLDHIFITHHHPDHTGGVQDLKQAAGCQVTAAAADIQRIPAVDRTVREGDEVRLGSIKFTVKELPGHTSGHIAYYSPTTKSLFSGDTFFAMGCGRLFEGTAAQMLGNFQWLRTLPEDTRIFCTHEYTLANSRFALSLEPHNQTLRERARWVEQQRERGEFTVPTTVGEELRTNPFARWDSPELVKNLRLAEESVVEEPASEDSANDSAVEIFAGIRRRKDVF